MAVTSYSQGRAAASSGVYAGTFYLQVSLHSATRPVVLDKFFTSLCLFPYLQTGDIWPHSQCEAKRDKQKEVLRLLIPYLRGLEEGVLAFVSVAFVMGTQNLYFTELKDAT